MSYVKQICDGYSKKSLLGNWYEERLYPNQPFREQQQKQARGKDEGITCFDQTGFQRVLPRIQRRSKWETTGRIILNDGYAIQNTTTKGSYGYDELGTASKLTKEPFSKNLSEVFSTELHPHSQLRVNKQEHKLLNKSTIDEIRHDRSLNEGKTFKSKLPSTLPHQKHTNFISQYKLSYNTDSKNQEGPNGFAGSYNQNPEEAVKITTNLIGEFKRENTDEKVQTKVQRSWVPPRDKSLIFGARETVKQIKQSSVPKNDIQTSLNMNIGIHKIHPSDVGNGYFGHKLSQITRNMNRSPCDR